MKTKSIIEFFLSFFLITLFACKQENILPFEEAKVKETRSNDPVTTNKISEDIPQIMDELTSHTKNGFRNSHGKISSDNIIIYTDEIKEVAYKSNPNSYSFANDCHFSFGVFR